jgi:hypothetical protein
MENLRSYFFGASGLDSVNKDGVTTMDLNSLGYREEPFIVQVFYGPDLGNNEGRHIVLQGKQKIIGVDNTIRKKGMDIRTCL